MKFNDAGDYLILQIDSDPGKFSCLLKQNGNATSFQFDIQYSTDGTNYTTFKTITYIGDAKSETISYDFSSLSGVRYIKWIYTTKGSSTNIALGTISVAKKTTTDPSSNISFSQNTGEILIGKTLDISKFVSTADGYSGTVTYSLKSGEGIASVSNQGIITGIKEGTAVITATAPGIEGSFAQSEADFTVTVVDNRTSTSTTFGKDVDGQTFVVNIGSTFEGKKATLTPAEAGEIKYSSDKPEVASVNEANGDITLGTVEGTATITAYFDENDTYEASSAKYYINVKDPNTPVFYESFDKTNGTGGNDGSWSGSIANNDLKYDNPGWTSENAKGANKCAKLGSGKKGTATTPTINLSNGTYTLTFRAGAWDYSDEKTTINVTISVGNLKYGETTASTQTITMKKAAWTDYSMTISGASSATTIKFSAINASNNRFFLDEVKIVQSQPQPTLTFSETEKTVYFKEEEEFKEPKLTLKDADGNNVEGATYNYASSNPEAISVDNSGKIKFETKNKPANVTITATYSGQVEEYKDLSASYEIKYGRNPALAYSNIKELKDYAIKDESVTLSLEDAQVVYANDKNVFVRDKSGAICFYNTGLKIKQNDILKGTLKATYTIFNGMPELIKDGTNTNANNLTITAGEAAQPKDLTHGSFADYTCDLVKVSKGVVDNNGTDVKLMNQDVEYAVFHNKFEINYSNPFNSAEVDVTGIVIPYVANGSTETIIEIAPTNKYDIVYRFSENDETTHVGAVSDAKVAIERTLSNKYWNTLCLPFSLSADQIKATFGGGTIITEFDDVNEEGTVMTFKEATSIEASKPYLFKPANTVKNPVFEGVTITSSDAGSVTVTNTNGNYAFVGTYSKKDMATDQSEVFITTSGKLSYPAEYTNTIKGMRAYIMLPTTANAKAFNLNIGGEATSIDTIDGGLLNGNATIYNLNGQKMSSDISGLAKGLYIVNGKKMIVK